MLQPAYITWSSHFVCCCFSLFFPLFSCCWCFRKLTFSWHLFPHRDVISFGFSLSFSFSFATNSNGWLIIKGYLSSWIQEVWRSYVVHETITIFSIFMKEFNIDNAFFNSPHGELVITFLNQSYKWSNNNCFLASSETTINCWYVDFIRGHRDTNGVDRPNEATIVMTMIFAL